jgi:hypothetical protein
MGLVPDKYTFVKESNNNVTICGYLNDVLIQVYSLTPGKDIRISQSYPESIVIPVDSIGNHVDNKFVAIPWKKIDFENSNPSSSPSTIFEALQSLSNDFFYL